MYQVIGRSWYEHEFWCTEDNFHPPNINGLKTCIDCAGIFDKNGKGVLVTTKLLDEPKPR